MFTISGRYSIRPSHHADTDTGLVYSDGLSWLGSLGALPGEDRKPAHHAPESLETAAFFSTLRGR